jgi:tetratricopeptide (TPR) repeat protein
MWRQPTCNEINLVRRLLSANFELSPLFYAFCLLCPLSLLYSIAGVQAFAESSNRSQETKNSTDYFTFQMTAADCKLGSTKIWSYSERLKVITLLDKVYSQSPSLFRLSTPIKPLRLIRISSYSDNTLIAPALAVSRAGEICFTDSFFHSSMQLLCLAHELVHTADEGGQFVYSKTWVDFANPIISEIRNELKHMDRNNDYLIFNKKIHDDQKWPGIYSTSSLQEGLADYYAFSLEDPSFACNERFLIVGGQLSNPSAEALDWNKSFAEGLSAFDQKEIDVAISAFALCTTINPEIPTPHIFLARCYLWKGDRTACIAHCQSALKRFDQLGVPAGDPKKFPTLKLLANTLQLDKKYKESESIVDEALSAFPADKGTLRLRANYEAVVGNFSASLEDACLALGIDDTKTLIEIERIKRLESSGSRELARIEFRKLRDKISATAKWD